MSSYPPLAIVLLTYDRLEIAKKALRALLDKVKYSGQLDLHIADDGSPEGYREELLELARGYSRLSHIGVSNAKRAGYGCSFNLATQVVHPGHTLVLPLEDDWELLRELNLDPLTDVLLGDYGVNCIRLGYIGFTQELRGTFFQTKEVGAMLQLDSSSPERHIAAGHPRLETVNWERAIGPWEEGLPAGMTEFEWCGREAARVGVAWPLDFVKPRGDLFAHIGTKELGEVWPEREGVKV